MSKPTIPMQKDYLFFFDIDTRWMDNDVYGHVNNVVYYSYFDSIANRFLIEHKALDIHNGQQIGLMVSSQCFYHSSVQFPDKLLGGFRVNRIGNSSVEYGLAIFKKGQDLASAHGSMTHVFVNKANNTPSKIEGLLKSTLEKALYN